MPCIEARGLRKAFGTNIALDGIDLRVEEGRILGLIGPKGGQTTRGTRFRLPPIRGAEVSGATPGRARQLMRDSASSRVAVCRGLERVSQALDYVAGSSAVRRAKAEGFLPGGASSAQAGQGCRRAWRTS